MNGATKTTGRTSETPSATPLEIIQRVSLALFLVTICFSLAQNVVSFRSPITPGISDAILLLLALASTLVSLSGQLPAQNVLLATVIIALFGGGIHALGAFTGIPFGPVHYLHESG